jgi:hypothetical protein
MAGVVLDARGVLVEYLRVPASDESPATTAPEWAAVLRRAGLDPDAARHITPPGIPPVFGDERLAWDLRWAANPRQTVVRGQPVWVGLRSALTS